MAAHVAKFPQLLFLTNQPIVFLLNPAPVARWLAHQTAGWKVLGLNPVRVMAGSYPELGVLWAQWEGRNHSAELHPLHGYIFESVALIT